MKKKLKTTKPVAAVKAKNDDFSALITEVRDLVQSARRGVASVVDSFQVMTNFEIGRRIVEHEQKGAKRAAYGAEVLKELSARLTEEFGRGFSVTNLKLMRQIFMETHHRIGQSVTDQLRLSTPTGQSPRPRNFSNGDGTIRRTALSPELDALRRTAQYQRPGGAQLLRD